MPKWHETYDFDVKYVGDDISLEVFDEDVTSNSLVGSCVIKISSLCMNGGIEDW